MEKVPSSSKMSQALPNLVQVALAGRYVKSLWGIVPRPRVLVRAPSGLNPDEVSSVGYERVARCLRRKKPLQKWPFSPHSLMEIETHLLKLSALEHEFECSYGLRLLARQADGYIAAWDHGLINARQEMQEAAKAFREIFDIAVSRFSDECPKCDALVKKRLALSGFVT